MKEKLLTAMNNEVEICTYSIPILLKLFFLIQLNPFIVCLNSFMIMCYTMLLFLGVKDLMATKENYFPFNSRTMGGVFESSYLCFMILIKEFTPQVTVSDPSPHSVCFTSMRQHACI